jgi:hypothetical protein
MIKFELFSLNIGGSNIDWISKTITINKNVKYIHMSLNHYIQDAKKDEKKDVKKDVKKEINKQNIKPKFNIKSHSWLDVITYWKANIAIYNEYFHIEFDKLVLGTHYYLAPIYINSHDLIIGIFLNISSITTEFNQIVKNDNEGVKSYRFLSIIKPVNINITKECNLKKFNLLYGAVEYQNEVGRDRSNHINDTISLDDNKYNIPLKCLLLNARNYLPKLEIIEIDNIASFTNIFQNRRGP